ncbi:hypothetical protein Bca101_013142 [Brassica carinata]
MEGAELTGIEGGQSSLIGAADCEGMLSLVLQTILEQVRSGFRQRSGNNQPLFLCRLDGLLIQIVGRLGHKPLGLCSQNIQGAKFFYIVQAYACYFAKEVLHVPSIPQSISVADLIAVCIMTCNLCSCFVRRNFGMRSCGMAVHAAFRPSYSGRELADSRRLVWTCSNPLKLKLRWTVPDVLIAQEPQIDMS